MVQMVKRLPTMQETLVQPLSREDLLEKEMKTHSSILAWKIPWMEKPGRLQSMGLQRGRHNLVTKQQQNVFFSSGMSSISTLPPPPSQIQGAVGKW